MAGRAAIGLDIGTSAVRAAQVSHGRDGQAVLERFGEVLLAPGAVRDGEVVDPPEVARAIKRLWSTAKISGKRVAIGVANQKVVVRMVDLPWMPPAELDAALPFHVQDFIPMPVEAAVLDFHAIEERTSESGARILRGLLVAASHEMVLASVSAVRAAGLTPVTVDLDSFALLRAVGTRDDLGVHGQVEALVDVGARVTNVVVHEGGVPRFVRILLMGGEDVVEAVAERAGVPPEQARETAWTLGVAAPAPVLTGPADPTAAAGATPAAGDPAARAVETAASSLLEEIRGSLDYYVASSGSAPIARTVLTGGGSRLAGLAARLQAATRIPVEPGNVLTGMHVGRVRLAPEQVEHAAPAAAVPVGLALGAAA